jgi:hypothetical protein
VTSWAWGQTQPAAASGETISGKVIETTNATTYTYVLVDTGTKKLWAAAPQFAVKVGDAIAIGQPMAMPNYHSKTLNRDFDVVYFTGDVKLNGQAVSGGVDPTALPKNHPPVSGPNGKLNLDFSGLKKADGGKNIAEIYAGKTGLGGKPVKVRGKVVKYYGDVLGKNWMHIQDGTGAAPGNDLTVTTGSRVKVGDTVLVSGTIALDRDFGSGYRYTVILEDATVTVE